MDCLLGEEKRFMLHYQRIQIRSGWITESRVPSGEHGTTPSGLGVGSFFFRRRESSSDVGPHSSQRGKKNNPTSKDSLPGAGRKKNDPTTDRLLYKNIISQISM